MKSFMKSARTSAMMLAIGIAATYGNAAAQTNVAEAGTPVAAGGAVGGVASPIKIAIGVITTCGVTSTTTINSAVIPSATVTATGSISFRAIGLSGEGQPSSTTQTPTTFTATASDPVLGTITWTLDGSRTATNTTVTANQVTGDFPATSTINIPVQATISSQPGKIYRSIGEVQFSSPNLRSFNPQNNENYTSVTAVGFEDAAAPSIPVFTIPTMTIIVNGNVAPPQQQQGNGVY